LVKKIKNKTEEDQSDNDKSTTKKLWKKIRTPVIITLTLLIFIWIFSQIDIYEVADVLWNTNLLYLTLAFVLIIPVPIISALRWQITLKAMGYEVEWTECLQMIMGVLPLTSITPSKSGDVLKGYYLKGRVPISKTVGSVLTERIFDVLALLILCIIGLIFFMKLEIFIIAIVLLGGVFLFFIISHLKIKLPVSEKWNERFQNLFVSTKTLFEQGRLLGIVIIYTFSLWIIATFQTYLFFLAVNITDVPILVVFANVPIAIFVGQIPVSLGGMGTRDYAFVILFQDYGVEAAELIGVGLLFSLVRYWTLSIAGIPYFFKYMKKK
jgi:uncharacterized protein (TIRG00374 family)